MQLHLIRHGQTDWNAQRRIQGQLDTSLNDNGRAQATALAPVLAALAPGAAYCSTSLRTRQTAELALNPPVADMTYRDELREINLGVWQGRYWEEIDQEAPEQVEHLRNVTPGFDVDGAESYAVLQSRGIAAIERIIEEAKAEVIVVVSHGAILKALLAHYAGRSLQELRQLPSLSNCAHSVMEASGNNRAVLSVDSVPVQGSAWEKPA